MINIIHLVTIQQIRAGIPKQLILQNLLASFTALTVNEINNARSEKEKNNVKKYSSKIIEFAFKLINDSAEVENFDELLKTAFKEL